MIYFVKTFISIVLVLLAMPTAAAQIHSKESGADELQLKLQNLVKEKDDINTTTPAVLTGVTGFLALLTPLATLATVGVACGIADSENSSCLSSRQKRQVISINFIPIALFIPSLIWLLKRQNKVSEIEKKIRNVQDHLWHERAAPVVR